MITTLLDILKESASSDLVDRFNLLIKIDSLSLIHMFKFYIGIYLFISLLRSTEIEEAFKNDSSSK